MSDDVVVSPAIGAVLNTRAGELSLTAHFSYSIHEPVAVAMTLTAEFEVGPGRIFTDEQTWVFARELLEEAMSTSLTAGDGDVAVSFLAVGDVLRFDLTDVRGQKYGLFVDAKAVGEFMAELP